MSTKPTSGVPDAIAIKSTTLKPTKRTVRALWSPEQAKDLRAYHTVGSMEDMMPETHLWATLAINDGPANPGSYHHARTTLCDVGDRWDCIRLLEHPKSKAALLVGKPVCTACSLLHLQWEAEKNG